MQNVMVNIASDVRRRCIGRLAAAAACVLMVSSLPAQALDVLCPLDRVVWKDSKSGREFVAEKAAQHLFYRCEGDKFIETEDEIAGCGNPRGVFYVAGQVSGQRAYAVLHIGNSVPCCQWDTFPAPDEAVEEAVKHWRQPGTAIEIPLLDELFTIEDNDDNKIGGPLKGGRYLAASCRREEASDASATKHCQLLWFGMSDEWR